MTAREVVPVERLGQLALTGAAAARQAIRDVQAQPSLDVERKRGHFDLVTAADKAAEAAVIAAIRASRPDDAILAEETGVHDGTTGVRWLIDPLDGTTNFVHSRPDHVVSVGVEIDGRLVAGAILRPVDGRWAMTNGDGTTYLGGINDIDTPPSWTPVGARPAVAAADALVVFALPIGIGPYQHALTVMHHLVPHVSGERLSGSAASDLLDVVVGRADAFIGCGLAPWDVAAGQALAASAGLSTIEVPTEAFVITITADQQLAKDLAAALASQAG